MSLKNKRKTLNCEEEEEMCAYFIKKYTLGINEMSIVKGHKTKVMPRRIQEDWSSSDHASPK